MNPPQRDLTRNTLAVLFTGGLILAAFWILQPFLAALIWAVMIVVSTWPMMRRVQRRLWDKRWLAVTTMIFTLLALLILPLGLAIGTIAERAGDIAALAKKLANFQLPHAPEWLGNVPLIGDRLLITWETFAIKGSRELALLVEPYVGEITRWFLAEAGSVGLVFVQFLLTVVLSAILYADGEAWAQWMLRFGRRLGNTHGEHAMVLAGQAIRGVAMGVVITALVQSILGGIGLAVAGVPFATVLTAIMFVFCIAQIGPVLVLLPAVGWLYWSDSTGWATFLLVWTVIVGTMDNVLRPYLIKQGADLPFLLILAGVVGGLLSFGLLGIFVGPVVLAVAYTLANAWIDDGAKS
ncbi:MAG TPA: AI-2E family transporter YdiK [Burkholderiales bacterium]|nr:AI-2E family transporter YdiK [Burkholderiales bacterium]